MSYIGNPIISTDFPKDTFSGNGSTTAFTMSIAPASVNSVIVVVSGITQDPSTYTISGTTLTFSAAPPTGTSNISVRHLGVAGIPNTPSAGSVTATSIADGVITAAKFASGQTPSFNGIAFPATQVPSADANTLDDYEEGTWTPVIADAASGGNTATYTNAGSIYTKIGNQVTIQTYLSAINTSGMTSGNVLYVRGLPFTANGTAQGNFYTYRVGRNASTVSSSVALNSGNTRVSFLLYTTNSAVTDLFITVGNITSGTSEIIFTLTYTV